jgi:hypothetical protein
VCEEISDMEMKKALKLREEWGDRQCDHPDIEKEDPIFGQWSGDWVCTQCGYSGPRRDFPQSTQDKAMGKF